MKVITCIVGSETVNGLSKRQAPRALSTSTWASGISSLVTASITRPTMITVWPVPGSASTVSTILVTTGLVITGPGLGATPPQAVATPPKVAANTQSRKSLRFMFWIPFLVVVVGLCINNVNMLDYIYYVELQPTPPHNP